MSKAPTKFAVALFDGFQALDVFGPLDVLNQLSKKHSLELYLIAPTKEAVSTLHKAGPDRIGQSIVPTHTYENAPEDIEVLLVPGGMGTRDFEHTRVLRDFLKARYSKLPYLLTVCTGSAIVAQTGILDGKEATTNKSSFSWVMFTEHVLRKLYPLTSPSILGRLSGPQRQVGKGGSVEDRR